MMTQLTLGLSLQDDATFQNFYRGKNQGLIDYLQVYSNHLTDRMIYIWGSVSSGLSHLLQACCHQAAEKGLTCLYLPLKQARDWSPELLQGLENLSLLAIDDLDAIAGQKVWEEELFHLYNRVLQQNTQIIFAGHLAAKQLPLALPDLQSRLNSLLSFNIQSLNDEEKMTVLTKRAHARGLELTTEVAQFLLKRCDREMAILFKLLERLDQASFVAQRKLTIPFVKSVLQI